MWRKTDALFLGNINVGIGHKKDYYYSDPNLIAIEIFADMSSIEVLSGTKDPLITFWYISCY